MRAKGSHTGPSWPNAGSPIRDARQRFDGLRVLSAESRSDVQICVREARRDPVCGVINYRLWLERLKVEHTDSEYRPLYVTFLLYYEMCFTAQRKFASS
jgi:hypothetical protein